VSNYVYDDAFDTISGTITGTAFSSEFNKIDVASASKGNIDAQTWTGTHVFATATVVTLTVSGVTTIDGGTW
jgi:hypothetical protein